MSSIVANAKTVVANGYDAAAERYLARFSASSVRDQWLDELLAGLPDKARILDLGCGAGIPVVRRLAAAGHAVTGIDGSSRQIALARSHVPGATFQHADMTTITLPAATYDGVAAFYSITHVPAAEQGVLLKRIDTWLKPGGIFLGSFGTGNANDWSGEWLGTKMFFSHNDDATTVALVQEAGLKIVRAEIQKQDDEDASFLWIVARKYNQRARPLEPAQ